MSYVYSIGPVIDFVECNKHKVMNLEKAKRFDVMLTIIRNNSEIYAEFNDRCCDELEDTEAEILEILEVI